VIKEFVEDEASACDTSLVRRFSAEIASQANVMSVTCDGRSRSEPLGPILEAAPQLWIDIAPLFAGNVPLDRLNRTVLDAFDPKRMAVVIGENAHWTDEATFGMLRSLAATSTPAARS
jgi:hypothetical protein